MLSGHRLANLFAYAKDKRQAAITPLLQGFRTPEEVERFGAMMDEMCYIVATKHSGSLKVPSSRLLSHSLSLCSCCAMQWSADVVDHMCLR